MPFPLIKAVRAYVVRGGGADYHDQGEGHWIDDHIATPMSRYPEYRQSRQSFGINVLGTLVVEIEAVAASLARYPNARIRVQGFADARGDAAANQTLALARANAVKNALAANGADARRIEAVSGGESNPVGSNASATGQAENRRTELVVVSR